MAVIFDMDGVLVDTEGLHYSAWAETLGKYGVVLTEQEYYDFWTKRGKRIEDFVRERGLSFDPEKLRKEKRAVYHEKLREHTPVIDGVEEVLRSLSRDFPLALASSSYRDDVDLIMKLTGFEKYFRATVSATESKLSKPDPSCFVIASSMIGIGPAGCLVVEDAQKGITAAKSIGMKAVAIPREYSRNGDFSDADAVLGSIRDLTSEFVRKILGQ